MKLISLMNNPKFNQLIIKKNNQMNNIRDSRITLLYGIANELLDNGGKQKNKQIAFDINLKLIKPQKQAKNNIHSEGIIIFIP